MTPLQKLQAEGREMFDKFWQDKIASNYDLNFETGDERRVTDNLLSFQSSLIARAFEEGRKSAEMEKTLLPRECEECSTIVYYKKNDRRSYTDWQDGAIQTGISKKYPGEIAGFCKNHKLPLI